MHLSQKNTISFLNIAVIEVDNSHATYRLHMFIFASMEMVYSKYGSSVDNIPVYATPVGGSMLKI